MLNLKYNDSSEIYKIEFSIISENIIEIKTNNEFPIKTSGFSLSRIGYNDNWDYSSYTTIYRQSENNVQFSNDGTIYIEPEPIPEPETPDYEYEPTLEELQEAKIREINSVQQNTIQEGVYVTLTNGIIEHFTLTTHDQTSLVGLQSRVASGEEQIPWHTSNQSEHCKFYSNVDMELITTTAMQYVTWHVTYFRDLRIYIRSLTSKEEIENIIYGMEIPIEYQSEPLKKMITAKKWEH